MWRILVMDWMSISSTPASISPVTSAPTSRSQIMGATLRAMNWRVRTAMPIILPRNENRSRLVWVSGDGLSTHRSRFWPVEWRPLGVRSISGRDALSSSCAYSDHDSRYGPPASWERSPIKITLYTRSVSRGGRKVVVGIELICRNACEKTMYRPVTSGPSCALANLAARERLSLRSNIWPGAWVSASARSQMGSFSSEKMRPRHWPRSAASDQLLPTSERSTYGSIFLRHAFSFCSSWKRACTAVLSLTLSLSSSFSSTSFITISVTMYSLSPTFWLGALSHVAPIEPASIGSRLFAWLRPSTRV
mmetsp:Transcript_34192/g.90065  ORF Transcript_34192/g.90065 Transcript_34192/m.90065 type:complete len:306 (+) Transcript_34192:1178-2095(+)